MGISIFTTHIGRALSFLLFLPSLSLAQDDLLLEQVRDNVWMISGGGYANVSVLAGDGIALVVDSKRAEHGDQIRAMVRELSGGEARFLINGHVHPDHTEGNEGFGESGTIIIAHEEVRRVLMAGQRGGPPAPEAALPVMTLADGEVLTLHIDGETVHVLHAPPAHSAGNLLVHYANANVIHMGDLYSPERYPVIAGGTIAGFIAANEMALEIADADTLFIAGNGRVTATSDLRAYIDMVSTVRQRVSDMLADGSTGDEILANGVTGDFNETWGDPARFLTALIEEFAAP